MSDFLLEPDIVNLPSGAYLQDIRHNLSWRGRAILSITQGAWRSYLHPVMTPQGYCVTTESPPDHPHHNAIWIGADRVRCALPFSVDDVEYATYNFYVNSTFQARAPGRIVSDALTDRVVARDHLRITQRLSWIGPPEWGAPEGRRVLQEVRLLDIRPDGNRHTIDVSSRLKALDWDVTLGPARHAYFGVRVVEALRPSAGGLVTDSDGNEGIAAVSGGNARWIDCSGGVAGNHVAGITVVRPEFEPVFPWQIAEYGTLTINPLAHNSFEIPTGSSVDFKIRFVIHDGAASEFCPAEL